MVLARIRGAQRPVRRRPRLLVLVYGVFLVLVGVTASAVVGISGVHLSNSTLEAVVSRDGSLVELFVNGNLRASDLDGSPSARRTAELDAALDTLTREDQILRLEIRDRTGRVMFSDDAGAPALAVSLADALAGRATAAMGSTATAQALAATSVVEELLPIKDGEGNVLAAVTLWRDAGPIQERVAAAQRDVVIVLVAAAALLALVLFALFRAAHTRLLRQQRELVEAERRDALTGMLNHGTAVAALGDAAEAARASGTTIGLALIDIDNFRLFNEVHGHHAADEVLLRVASLVRSAGAEGDIVARYGPDEFLLARSGVGVGDVRDLMETLRAALSDTSVRFGESEALPITVSAGVAGFPAHGASVTELLTTVAMAVGEARASGGDNVSEPRRPDMNSGDVPAGFGLLTGLVIAVDTKDRYTKRHSEDVARYAVFLADRLGLDAETRATLHVAGLLHDVGKIGIPDTILRKPARLTAEEYDIFKQHVALGDSIVRDVPHVDSVRAGIRHHHERWDGNGYLDGLEGENIPLVGRILAVADAFSAMTTTRPYRKALPIEEALDRLGDAAGTQLEERLVVAFIAGITTAPDAPLPGVEPGPIWVPERWVA